MTDYDNKLTEIYGKVEPTLSEKDLDRLEDDHYAQTQGFKDCPHCRGECELAGGEVECENCSWCQL